MKILIPIITFGQFYIVISLNSSCGVKDVLHEGFFEDRIAM